MHRFLAPFLVLALALAAACGGDDDTTVDLPGGGEVSISEDLPDEFPDDFPVYDDADFINSIESSEAGAEGIIATWETGDGIDDVRAFYEDELGGGQPWRSSSTTNSGDSSVIAFQREDDANSGGFITLVREDDKTTIAVFVGEGITADGDGEGDEEATPEDGDTGDSDSGDGADGASAELPDEVDLSDDYPGDRVPLPDGARVTSTTSLSAGGTTTHFVEFYSEQSTEELADYFESELTANGWTETFTTTDAGDYFLGYSGGDAATESVTVNIAASDVEGYSQVAISVVLGE